MRAIQGVTIGHDVTESIVVIGGPYGDMGEGSKLSVVPAVVEVNGRMRLTCIDLILTRR